LPSFKLPCQTALALRSISLLLGSSLEKVQV